MFKNINCFIIFSIFLCIIMSGCTKIPPVIDIESMNMSVGSDIQYNTPNGSIFQKCIPGNYKYQSLFEDYRPKNVGDIMSVILEESVIASNSSFSNMSKNGNSNLGVTTVPGLLHDFFNKIHQKVEMNGSSKNNFLGKGSNYAKNSFVGTITVTVSKTFPNGNLRVVGEKRISINQGTEFIRFSGIVNPNDIFKNNSIVSTKIANPKIEYLSHGYLNEINSMGWLQRLFLNVFPI